MAYGGDLTFIQIVIGYVIARVILAILLVPHYFKGDIYSPYQLLTRSFGPLAGKTCAGIFLIAGTLAAGVRVYATSIPLHLMTDINITLSAVLFILLSLVYMYMGGIKSVIWTEVLQFFLFVGGGVFTLFYIPTLLEGSFAENLVIAKEAGKLHWFNGAWGWQLPFNIWMGVIGATVQVLSSHGADQLIVQRVLSCRSAREGSKALILSAVLIFPLFLIFLFTGILLWIFYSQHPADLSLPDGKVDYVFPLFILSKMPIGVKGFLIVAIFSAAMSSVASALSALASVFVMDFVKPILRARSDQWYLRFSKISTLFWAILLIVVVKISQTQPVIFNWAFSLNGLTSGALLAGLILALYAQRVKPMAVVLGMVGSVVVMILLQVIMEIYKVKCLAWPWFTLTGTLCGLFFSFLLSTIGKRSGQIPSQKE
jgi:solute:Na+ symporter, SSS family